MKRENAVDQKLYDKGMELRTAVMGKAYVDRALAANQDDIGKPIQDFITEHGWGAVWGREGLSPQDAQHAQSRDARDPQPPA